MDLEQKAIERIRLASDLSLKHYGKPLVCTYSGGKDSDIWEFINSEHIETCELYQCGYDRVGCIGCTMAGKKRCKEFADFPKYKQSYIRAFERMLDARKEKELETQWETGEDVFRWRMNDDNLDGQMELSDFIEY